MFLCVRLGKTFTKTFHFWNILTEVIRRVTNGLSDAKAVVNQLKMTIDQKDPRAQPMTVSFRKSIIWTIRELAKKIEIIIAQREQSCGQTNLVRSPCSLSLVNISVLCQKPGDCSLQASVLPRPDFLRFFLFPRLDQCWRDAVLTSLTSRTDSSKLKIVKMKTWSVLTSRVLMG